MEHFCQSCGGVLQREGNYNVCKFCGTRWIIDVAEDIHAVDRANAWSALRECDFARATELFENILVAEPDNHEAHWGRALAMGGIIYVTDINENKRVPTCNNITEESFLRTKSVQKAIASAPADIAEGYRRQAEQIDRIRVEWLEKARKEPPYDIFICFKDSDRERGIERTKDSIDAQDLYNALVAEGYKVFFSRISLRNKISEQYEPYIYNALKTAKVMIVFGERAEYFNAVWLKNEWSRFCARIEKNEKHKESLVVVYKDMDPGDLPAGLRTRQALNYADPTSLLTLTKHIKRVIAESKQSAHLGRVEIKGGQIAKKATTISANTIETREVGAGASAETTISAKQQMGLVKSYVNANQWGDAQALLDDILLHNLSYAEAVLYSLMIKHRVKQRAELIKALPRFTKEDYALVERTLSCADKTYAAELLEQLYRAGAELSEPVWLALLRVITPYNFEGRQAQITRAFETAITKHYFEVFDLLLSTLDRSDVDTYISYNLRYCKAANIREEQRICAQRVLEVDAGNIEALSRQYLHCWVTGNSRKMAESLEALLRYTPDVKGSVTGIWSIALMKNDSTCYLKTEEQSAFLVDSVKYYPGELSEIGDKMLQAAERMIALGFFGDAERLLRLILTFDPNNASVYWGLCLIKVEAKTENDVIFHSHVLLKTVPEYTKYLTLVDEGRRQECMNLTRQQEQMRKRRKQTAKKRVVITLVAIVTVAVIVLATVYFGMIRPAGLYEEATGLLARGQYDEAYDILDGIGFYKDSKELVKKSKYERALAYIQEGEYEKAQTLLADLGSDYNATEQLKEIKYLIATEYYEKGMWKEAFEHFSVLSGYKDSATMIQSVRRGAEEEATVLAADGKYEEAYKLLENVGLDVGTSYDMEMYQALMSGDYKAAAKYGAETVIVPAGTQEIETSAFAGCGSLKNVVLPEGLQSIYADAFAGCTSLTEITIPESVETISDRAFSGCASLKSVTVEGTPDYVGVGVLYGCTAVENLTLSHMDGRIVDLFGTSYAWDNTDFTVIPDTLKSVTVTGGDTVASEAFCGCSGLQEVILPDTVTSIGERAFENCSSLTALEIPADVVELRNEVFDGCASLTSLEIPEGVTTIGEYAFAGCSSLTALEIPEKVEIIRSRAFYECTGLTEVVLPKKIYELGEGIFAGCSNLTALTLPAFEKTLNGYFSGGESDDFYYVGDFITDESTTGNTAVPSSLKKVTVWGNGNITSDMFKDCKNLTTVVLEEGIENVYSRAFQGCSALTDVSFPATLKLVDDYAFLDCTGLTELIFPANGSMELGTRCLAGCTALTGLSLPNAHYAMKELFGTESGYYNDTVYEMPAGLTSIKVLAGDYVATYAFENLTALTSVELPDGITSIGGNAFYNCSGLTELPNMKSVTEISSYAFAKCIGLTSITIPESVTSISTAAFSECPDLTSVTLEGDPDNIESGMLQGCNKIESISLGASRTISRMFTTSYYGSEDEYALIPATLTKIEIRGGTKLGSDALRGCAALTELTLPDTLTTIDSSALKGCIGLTSLDLPDSITSIGSYAFEGCSELTELLLPDSLETLGASALKGCVKLTELSLPDALTTIEDMAFQDCTGLIALTLPGNIAYGSQVLYGCTGLTSLTLGSADGEIEDLFGYVVVDGVRSVCPSLKKVTILGGDTVESSTFAHCRGLTTIVLPETIKTIGSYAFSWCESLISVNIPDDVESIGVYAFQGCAALKTLTLPSAIEMIDSYTFTGCKALGEITLPAGVHTIETYAFQDCTSLKAIYHSESLNTVRSYAFAGCSTLKSLSLAGVEVVGSNIFVNCYDLESITLPDGSQTLSYYFNSVPNSLRFVTVDGGDTVVESAFYGCSSLVSVSLPDTVKSIGKSAFYNCYSLSKINIPQGVEILDDQTFYNCSSLVSITVPESVTGIGTDTFDGCYKLMEVYNLSATLTVNKGETQNGDLGYYAKDIYTSADAASKLSEDQNGYIFYHSDSGYELVGYCGYSKELTLPETHQNQAYRIGSYAFYRGKLTEVTIPEGITEIGSYAFAYCSSLAEVNLPSSITAIREKAFRYCSGLTQITLSESLQIIENYAFESCTGLKSITIPLSVTEIDRYAFSHCSGIETAYFNNPNNWLAGSTGLTLTNTKTAAKYLTETYNSYKWTRS